jgi:hypothetical protein
MRAVIPSVTPRFAMIAMIRTRQCPMLQIARRMLWIKMRWWLGRRE